MFFKKIKKVFSFLLAVGWFLFFFYLLLPEPQVFSFPAGSFYSQEKKIKNCSFSFFFYTDLNRQEVVRFYRQNFSSSPFFRLPLFTYRLSHPPEKVKEILGEKEKASYVEEVVHPLKSSLFILGYEWEKDPFVPQKKRVKNKIVIKGRTFKSKVTLCYRSSFRWERVFVFLGASFLAWLIFLNFCQLYDSFRRHR